MSSSKSHEHIDQQLDNGDVPVPVLGGGSKAYVPDKTVAPDNARELCSTSVSDDSTRTSPLPPELGIRYQEEAEDADSTSELSASEDEHSVPPTSQAARRSSIEILGDIARRASEHIAELWPLAEATSTSSSTKNFTKGTESEANSGVSDSGGSDLTSDQQQPRAPEEVSEGAESIFRRASSFLTEGLFTAGDEAEEDQPHSTNQGGAGLGMGFASGNSSSSNGGAAGSATQEAATTQQILHGVHFDELRQEVCKPFQRLLGDIPDFSTWNNNNAITTRLVFANSANEHATNAEERDLRSPLLSAVARSRLIGRVLGCCESVIYELSPEEAQLWEAFVSVDVTMKGSMSVHGPEVRKVFEQITRSTDRISAWIRAIAEWADDNDEIDFADLLDWFAGEKHHNQMWAFQTSLRSSFVQLLNTSSSSSQMGMRPEQVTQIRNRCAAMTPVALGSAAASCQRTLVLTTWCQCERRLLNLVSPASSSSDRGPPPGPLSALIAVLRGINSELAPTERVLWELLGSKDADFDGALDKNEVLAAVGELLVYSIERELGTPEAEFEELQRLRADCRRRSVDALFDETGPQRIVTLADVLRWWWDMTEEYRVAAGLCIPAVLLRRSLHRRPEEMFRDKLPRIAANPTAARVALRGHARVLAELRALAVSRAIENLQGRSSPTDTWTTTSQCTSEVTDATSENKSRPSDDEDDNDGADDVGNP